MNPGLFILLVMANLYLGARLPFWIGQFLNYVEKRKIIKSSTPTPIKEGEKCRVPHSFLTIKGDKELGISEAKVCRGCGWIKGTGMKASFEAVDSIDEVNKLDEIEEGLYKAFLTLEDKDIIRYFSKEIEGGLSFEKLTRLHEAGSTFHKRYAKYKTSKMTEIKKKLAEETRSNA